MQEDPSNITPDDNEEWPSPDEVQGYLDKGKRPPEGDSILDTLLKDPQVKLLLQKEGWTITDLYEFQDLTKKYKEQAVIPFSKEWMKSTPDRAAIWKKAVKIIRNVALLIGDVDGFDEDDEAMRRVLENEIDQNVYELEQAGIDGSFSLPEGTLENIAPNPDLYVKYFAQRLINSLPKISISTHYNQIKSELGETLKVDVDSEEPVDLTYLDAKENKISKENRDWNTAAGIVHISDIIWDCHDEMIHGLE